MGAIPVLLVLPKGGTPYQREAVGRLQDMIKLARHHLFEAASADPSKTGSKKQLLDLVVLQCLLDTDAKLEEEPIRDIDKSQWQDVVDCVLPLTVQMCHGPLACISEQSDVVSESLVRFIRQLKT